METRLDWHANKHFSYEKRDLPEEINREKKDSRRDNKRRESRESSLLEEQATANRYTEI